MDISYALIDNVRSANLKCAPIFSMAGQVLNPSPLDKMAAILQMIFLDAF